MKKPNYKKMRIKLNRNVSDAVKESYNKLSDEDILYEYIKVYGEHLIPKENV
jgi:hypothetical protein